MTPVLSKIGQLLAKYLAKPSADHKQVSNRQTQLVAGSIRSGDVLLVDGSSRISKAIKYLTQSTWSHAALCIEDQKHADSPDPNQVWLLEADVIEGVRIISLAHYQNVNTRICRPVGLNAAEIEQAIAFAKAKVGHQYDTKNVLDLMRYLIQTPPVPTKWRRNMLALGSGDPTKAICSTLVAQTFQSIQYPILPEVSLIKSSHQEVYTSRHYSLFVPKDFDLSPYFNIIKPTIEQGFDPHKLNWQNYNQPE
ncbi:YiiX/YebB-like N1pC/P60 family cysteine hydrolase [Paraglaciecola aestuariivivens]